MTSINCASAQRSRRRLLVVGFLLLVIPQSHSLRPSLLSIRQKHQGLASALSAQNSEDDVSSSSSKSNMSLTRSSFLASIASTGMALTTGASRASAAPPVSDSSPDAVLKGQATTSLSAKQQVFQDSVSGFAAGAAISITKTIVKYPLDSATVRLQMPNSEYSIFDIPTLFKGSYRGVLAPLVSNIPAGAVFFAVKDACKSSLKEAGLPRWLTTSLAVGVAQVPYWLVRNPTEVVKTRQQAGLPGYGAGIPTWEAYRQVKRDASDEVTDQIAGFYLGYFENILYAYPADVIKFICYEQFSGGRKNLPPVEGALAGAAATAVAQFVTTPLDVVRNRIMAKQTKSKDEEKESTKRVGYWQSLVKLGQQEGLAGLFAGATPRVGKALLSGAIQFATYEETKQQVAKLFQISDR